MGIRGEMCVKKWTGLMDNSRNNYRDVVRHFFESLLNTSMKSLLTAFTVLFLSVTFCNAQASEKIKINAVSFELGKTGLIYNLTFDHKLTAKILVSVLVQAPILEII